MGKNLIQQARGKGGPRYRSPGHRFYGRTQYLQNTSQTMKGVVRSLVKCPGHSAPLADIVYSNGESAILIAPEGIRVGSTVMMGENAEASMGNTLPLKNIPEGTFVYNIELMPGDGGKFVRSSGTFAKVISHAAGEVLVMLPSKKQRQFNADCRASIGTVAASGRKEKPFIKAGRRHHYMKARNKLYPRVSGVAMNAVDHPFGGSRTSKKGKPTIAPRDAPPGRKVGMVRPSRTGRKVGNIGPK
jgi:large subunit ribosomal protein L2